MKFFSVFLLSLTFFIFSCSNNSDDKIQTEEFETLKEETQSISAKITWTDELESGRLTDKLKNPEGIGNKVKASVLSVVSKKETDPKFIYPSLEGFGSLDTSLIPLNLKSEVLKFCGAFSKNQDLTSLTRKESLYNLALFYYDFDSQVPAYKAFFEAVADAQNGEENDSVKEKTAENQQPKDDKISSAHNSGSDSNSENVAKTESPEKIFFDSFKLGEPYIDGVNYDVPVLFSFGGNFLALETYWTLENSQWMLDQIQIQEISDKTEAKKQNAEKVK